MTFPKIPRGRSTAQQMEERRARVQASLQAGHSPEQIAEQEGISLQWALRNIERARASQDLGHGADGPVGAKPRFDPTLRLAATIEGWLDAVDRIAEVLDRLEFFLRAEHATEPRANRKPPSTLGLAGNEAEQGATTI